VRLSEHSEPQPDLALLRRREDFYSERHPRPADVLLVDEPDLGAALEVSALSGVAVELQRLFG
jgi:hypothetical protein